MGEGLIADNYRRIRDELPDGVGVVVAAKGRASREVEEVIEAGARMVGENYVQEAQAMRAALGEAADAVQWHMIGPLQRNKVNRAIGLFDVIQTLDAVRLARALDERSPAPMRTYLEVNIGDESSKSGVDPGHVPAMLEELSTLGHIRVEGLMTIEPYFEDPEKARPYLARMRDLFDRLRPVSFPNVDLRTLSMGMSGSWRVAVEEGATMVRIGTAIFGPRPA